MNGFGQLTTILASDSANQLKIRYNFKIKIIGYFVNIQTMIFTIQICLLRMLSFINFSFYI